MPNFIIITLSLILLTMCGGLGLAENNHVPKAMGPSLFESYKETIGPLRLDFPEEGLPGVIACVPEMSADRYDEANRVYVETWNYAGCGLTLTMGAPIRGTPKCVTSICVSSPSTYATSLGIGIGSTESAVIQAYRVYRNPLSSISGKRFVAGALYNGLTFDFENGVVVRMYLGVTAG